MFLKVIQECDGILVSEVGDATREETVDLKPGDQHIIPFKSVASSVANGSVLLI